MFSKKVIFLAFFSILILSTIFFFIINCFSSSVEVPTPPISITNDSTTSSQQEDFVPNQSPIVDIDGDSVLNHNATHDEIRTLLESLTIEEKIGQLFIFGFEGKVFDQAEGLRTWIDEYKIGNFIVFKRNINTEAQLISLISDLHNNTNLTVPIWVGIDQEGGVVNRLPTKYPSAKQFAKWDDPALTYDNHLIMADHLKAIGININFGPVLDVNSNPNNPVINTRAFGDNVESVIKHTEAVIRAYDTAKLLAVGKHFPGHGDTSVDSHYELPVITKSWEELLKLELLPFQHALTNHLPSIMVGHLLIREVDDTLPASLSPILIQEKLIKEMGFEGIIMTDDLIMEGILSHYSIGEATVLALQAGVHMVIIGHEKKKQLEAIEAVKVAVEERIITTEQLDEKVYRILEMKQKYEN